jgi:hypothetical protein
MQPERLFQFTGGELPRLLLGAISIGFALAIVASQVG